MEHNAHHERPSIPLYNLSEAQKKLVAKEESLVELRWTPASHLDLVRRCKLYDFEADRWLDFKGNYTSPSTKTQTKPAVVPRPHFDKKPAAKPSNSATNP